MYDYFVAFSGKNHSISEPLGVWAECSGHMSTYEFAKIIAKNRIRDGFKNVTIFKYYGNPYDKIMTHCVSWDLVMKNKID